MGWNREPSETVAAPLALSPARWVAALMIAGLASVSLFLLHASQRLALLQHLNIWLFSLVPMLVLVLVFALRAFRYGGSLGHHEFLRDEAQAAQDSWEEWTSRYLKVHDSCVLLPGQVSAAVLAKGIQTLPLQTGRAQRLAMLPEDDHDRIQFSLVRLLEALQPSLQGIGSGLPFRVTLLSDSGASRNAEIAEAWRRAWINVIGKNSPATVVQVEALSLAWIDEKISMREVSLELILVVQTEGSQRYSDALAALLVGLDVTPVPDGLPVKTRLLRPMPLEAGDVSGEMAGLLQSQAVARSATGVLADVARWQQAMAPLLATSRTLGGSLQLEQQWNQENFCGVPGPFSSWVGLALGVELVQHRQQALLVLGKEQAPQWITTIAVHEEVA